MAELILALFLTPECEHFELPIYTGQAWCFELPDPNEPADPNSPENRHERALAD